ncbi:MAG: oligosaccharide flippase family protein, partial [Deltaproteobacteria bacterium]|nr:oligosaccharide flippase family protein [Deltaproteobacteria bacterium]
MFKNAYLEIKSALLSKTGKNTALALVSQIAIATLSYILNILLIRKMSISDYGIFSLFSSVLMLLSGVIHLGWMESYVRFGSEYSQKPEAMAVEKFFFKRIIITSITLSLLVLIFSTPISEKIYHRKDFTFYFFLGVLGALFLTLYNLGLSYFRAHQKFKHYTILDTTTTTFRVLLGLSIISLGIPLLTPISIIYLIVPFLGFIAFCIMKKTSPDTAKLTDSHHEKFNTYNSWLVVSWVAVHFIGNIDSQFLAYYHNNEVVAAFSAVSKLTLPIHFIIRAIYTTLLPRLSQTQKLDDIKLYLSKMKYFLIPISILLIASCWFLPSLLIWFAGNAYKSATFLIQIQIITVLIDFLCTPLSIVL